MLRRRNLFLAWPFLLCCGAREAFVNSLFRDERREPLKTEGLAGQYLNSNYGHLEREDLAGQYLDSNYGFYSEFWQDSA